MKLGSLESVLASGVVLEIWRDLGADKPRARYGCLVSRNAETEVWPGIGGSLEATVKAALEKYWEDNPQSTEQA